MQLFISHIHEERGIAEVVRDELLSCFGAQVDVFLAEDVPLGTNWLDEIKIALGRSDVLIVLFSKHSSSRPWINIEAGYGVMAGKQVIPVCHSGFSKAGLPVIYGLLQAADLLAHADIDRLLDQIARATTAGRFLGDKAGAVTRWIDNASDAVRLAPGMVPPLHEPPCVWVVGSNRGLNSRQTALNERFVSYVAQAFMQRRFRVVFGRSGLLDSLGDAMSKEADAELAFGIERDTLSAFGNASAMHKESTKAPPNPVVLLGSFRSDRGVGDLFVDSIGYVPDVTLVIGGATDGRTREEVGHAREAHIPVLPLHFTGGVAEELEAIVDSSLVESVANIQEAQRDYSSVAQLVCDVIVSQTRIRRST